jgi:hypothetical protein
MAELEPLPLQPTLTHPPPLPESKKVTQIEGESFSQFQAREERERAEAVAFKPGEEEEAIRLEDEILDLRNENAERRDGKTPIRLLAKYKKQIGIFTALAAGAGLVIKGCL